MKRVLLAAVAALCLLSLPSCDLTLGPKTKQVYTIVYPGRPLQVLENQTVTGRLLEDAGDGAPVRQDVGGWVAMPVEHFEALKRAAGMSRPGASETR
jgi:hypothetical protein